MTQTKSITPLAKLVGRLENNARFMAYVLAQYRKQEELTLQELVEELGAVPAMLVRLALCGRPDTGSPEFSEQLREIADYTLTDEVQLAEILRQVEVLEKFSQRTKIDDSSQPEVTSSGALSGLLAAARDRSETKEDEPPISDDHLASED